MAKNIPMHSKDGRPWIATSEVESMELMSAGYTLDKAEPGDGKQAPPAESASDKGKPANAPSKNTPGSTG